MTGAEYVVLFVCVTIMEFGIPGPGDASLLAAGTLAGEGRLNVGIVFVVSVGRVDGRFGHRVRGRAPRGTPAAGQRGWLEKRRRNLLAKGDRAFGGHTFIASVTLPAFVSGIFRVRFWLFVLGAMAAGVFFVGLYVGLSYLLGEEVAERIGNADTTAIVSVLVIVAIGLGIRAGYARWRATRQAGKPGQSNAKSGVP
jgi:membrane protein DedA with SNARE-associated domain